MPSGVAILSLTRQPGARSLGTPGRLPSLRRLPEESVMLLVGLTGNIGSGKSTVAQLLSERGATIIDADVLARRAVELGTAGLRQDRRSAGASSVLAPDGHLDRAALRRVVFADHEQLEELNHDRPPRSRAPARRASSTRRASAATGSSSATSRCSSSGT